MRYLVLPLPETTNHIYRSSGRGWYKSAKAKAWEEEAGWRIKQEKIKKPLTGPVEVLLVFYLKRDRDIDGGIKPVLDILQKHGIYTNDSQVVKLTVIKRKDITPRTQITITPLASGQEV